MGADADNTTSERGNMNNNASPSWGNLAKLWDAMYGIIEDANLTLEGINSSSLLTSGGSEQKTMERFKGESLALRGMIYFDFVRFFGDVPLKLVP